MITNPEDANWPPSYRTMWQQRQICLCRCMNDATLAAAVDKHYEHDPIGFIQDWCITIDPRNPSLNKPARMPFILFKRQKEFIEWLHNTVMITPKNGVVDKCRGVGATWLCVGYSVWVWKYVKDAAIGWGSRKNELVDGLDDPKTIFSKLRTIINDLPPFLMPTDFNPKKHMPYMRIINPELNSSIVGEGGKNIGRGGRTLVYFKDESAFYENPLSIEGALGENTNVQIDISTHNGTGTVFYQKTENYPAEQVFTFDWWQHPNNDQAWFDERQNYYCNELGAPHLFAQEILRDPRASVEGVVIPSQYVQAGVDAHKTLFLEPEGERRIGLDVIDEGGDMNATCYRHGIVIKQMNEWHEGTTTETTDKALGLCDSLGCYLLVYDSIGVGAGVKGAAKDRAPDRAKKKLPKVDAIGWNAGGAVIDPDLEFAPGKTNKDMFSNAKAQAWWELRLRFVRTWEAIEKDELHEPDTLISIDGGIEFKEKLIRELSQPTFSVNGAGKIVIDKKPEGARSPNLADAVVMAFARLKDTSVTVGVTRGLY